MNLDKPLSKRNLNLLKGFCINSIRYFYGSMVLAWHGQNLDDSVEHSLYIAQYSAAMFSLNYAFIYFLQPQYLHIVEQKNN